MTLPKDNRNTICASIKEQIEHWQYNNPSKKELNTLISNLLCELAQYDIEVNLLVTKNTD